MCSQLVNTVLTAMLDSDAQVRHAACSAVSVVIENAGDSFLEHKDRYFEVMDRCFELNDTRTRLVLCDTIGQFADNYGNVLEEDSATLTPHYMPHIMRFSKTFHELIVQPLFVC